MKPRLLPVILLMLAVLISCSRSGDMPESGTAEISLPSHTEETAPESMSVGTDTSAETDAPFPDHTKIIETEPPSETIPIPEQPAESESATPEPLILPEGIHTNITHTDAAEILRELWDLFEPYPDAALYFTDETGEFRMGIREDMKFHSASTVKAPYCQYLIASGADLTQSVQFTASTRTSASGFLTAARVGTFFTVGELMEYTIRHSDNQAYRLLLDTFSTEEYGRYAQSIGAPGLALTDGEWAFVTPQELSAAMLEIHRTSETNPILAEHLKNASFNAQISAGTEYETAHKYGYNGGDDGYHDTAIVFAHGRAYILTVMTHLDFAVEKDPNALFRTAASLCDRLHAILFPSHNP